MRILLVEDDKLLGDGIQTGLGLEGFTVDWIQGLKYAQSALASEAFDVMVLDLSLPDGSGIDLLMHRRTLGDPLPVLILTARDTTEDRVAGLDAGADDYLTKPFALAELAARIRALHRRGTGRCAPLIECGNISLNPVTRGVYKHGKPVSVSRREFAILQTLMEAPGWIFSRRQLEDRLYGWDSRLESNAIEVHIHNLRRKLGGRCIETVRGEGYRFRDAE